MSHTLLLNGADSAIVVNSAGTTVQVYRGESVVVTDAQFASLQSSNPALLTRFNETSSVSYQPTVLLGGGEEVLPRFTLGGSISLTSQLLRLTYFTALRTEVINNLVTYTSSIAAAATPTLCRGGVYSIDAAGAGTLVASIANDTTLWAAVSTKYTRALSAPFNKVAGQLYALALLCVSGTTIPTTAGNAANASTASIIFSELPRLYATLAAQNDLPASYADASLTNIGNSVYARFTP